ncbi:MULTISPECIES: long-chain-fatty-acid--CoA ligase [unclassified Chelatococcus]|uniref:class I adenylate-forming enzyme family protein n=1 Tax=unclassified Chelatococcus TaxID=2638111 RepID=UPI001BCC3C1E|nr:MULTISPECIES: long-chain-fatty-acid--CoA ligase [unclassified Chelatococcus]CAH1650277.1 Fatty-acyl-CoA synthase [Hyphomicrobiales bacterium]MBS7743327.1 long-chain-fatty-acid--CoA ligase [Chelatococcus sp. HY11]MBX3541555.1 long-chain-fatty-acid--CoA ligase [Chelatococcus sp.]MCO5074553.1 long-chain-fatty-acid--CoA ligase [Chelatococcus sp.]CAH1692547.1 Fatty-acyl-CoA synthase [Hyphomicrobiales bacterium]
MDLSDLIDRNAAFTPDKVAIRFEGATFTYRALSQRIAATARALKSHFGVGRGDRVAILAANHPDYLVLLYACARLGAMLVPINWRLAVPEQVFILTDASVKVLFVEETYAAVVAPLAEAAPETRVVGLEFVPPDAISFDDLLAVGSGDGRNPHIDFSCPLLIVYTSGTTGRPKGAVLRQEALVWNAAMSQHMHGLTSDDHILTVLPFFHVGGLNIQTTPALHLGATVTIHRRFAPDATLAAIAEDRTTHTVLVPTTIQAVVAHPDWATTDLSSLRALSTGSVNVPQQLIDAVAARGIPVLQVYGSTETCPIAVYTRLGGEARGTSTGLPGLHCEARIVNEKGEEVPHGTAGEVVVRGPSVFFEYWGNEAATAEALKNGWYYTGDIGTRDADGYFHIHDRKKNVIISGGENIYPAELERVLGEHVAVAEVAVIGRPDPRWQEVPVAYVVIRRDCAVDAEALIAHARDNLARFKVPREIVFVDSLPRNAMGKVQHFVLKQQLA